MTGKYSQSLFTALLLLITVVSSQSSPTKPAQNILVLNSYDETYHWTERMMLGIKSVLEPQADIELFITYMDTKRFHDEAYFDLLNDLYARKYSDITFNAIISTDDHALNFLIKHRDDLFPGVPVFFSGINDFQPARIAGEKNYSGICETYDVEGTVRAMLKIHPKTKNIVTITDHSVTGLAFLNLILRAKEQFNGQVQFEHLHNLPLDEMCAKLSTLPPDTLVLWAIYTKMPDGKSISSKASLQKITAASPVPVYSIWDVIGQGVMGGKITSPAFQGETVAGMALDYLHGKPVKDLSVSDSPMVYRFDHNVMQKFGISQKDLPAGSQVINAPFSIIQQYKTVIWTTFGFLLLLITIILLLIHDMFRKTITDKKLRFAREELARSRKMEAIGQLAGGVAHDFNNMLSAIAGAAELLEDDVSAENHKFIEIILTLVDRAAQLTAKLLAFGRKGTVILQPTNLQRIIEGCADILKSSLNKTIAIETHFNAETPTISADESQITNIFLNLGINAEQSMPQGGTLTFKTSIISLDQAFCDASEFKLKPGRYICAEISDTGNGIAPDHLSKIFEPFFSTNELGRGSGLGLASVYGSIAEHHGAIYVHSETGIGTVFSVYLPLIDNPGGPAAMELKSIRGNGELILVVEDEELIRTTTAKTLKDLNYRILTASNGKEATEEFKEHADDIDLVLMDVIMPEMSGRKAAEYIREINSEAKIIFISGFTGEEAFGDELLNINTEFLRKPCRKEELSQTVAFMLNNNADH